MLTDEQCGMAEEEKKMSTEVNYGEGQSGRTGRSSFSESLGHKEMMIIGHIHKGDLKLVDQMAERVTLVVSEE